MGSEMAPSLISWGGLLGPPNGSRRIWYPMGGRVKAFKQVKVLFTSLSWIVWSYEVPHNKRISEKINLDRIGVSHLWKKWKNKLESNFLDQIWQQKGIQMRSIFRNFE